MNKIIEASCFGREMFVLAEKSTKLAELEQSSIYPSRNNSNLTPRKNCQRTNKLIGKIITNIVTLKV